MRPDLSLPAVLLTHALVRAVLPSVVEHIIGSLEQRVWFDDDVDYANARIEFLLLCIAHSEPAERKVAPCPPSFASYLTNTDHCRQGCQGARRGVHRLLVAAAVRAGRRAPEDCRREE